MARTSKKETSAGKRWLVAVLVVALILAPITINAFLVASTTRPAEARDGGTIVETSVVSANVKVEGEGPAIVLIHGFGAALDWWDAIAPALAAEHKVIRLDLIGHGGTEAPSDGYTIERQAELVADVLDKLGVDKVTAIGHSMGGEVATALAAAHPALVERLVLIDTPAKAESAAKFGLMQTPLWGELMWRFTTQEDFRKALVHRFAPGFEVPEKFVADLERLTYTAFHHAHRDGVAYETERPLVERLAALNPVPPILVIRGSRDKLVGEANAKLFEQVPGATVVTIDGPGHSPMVEAPDQTRALITDFLSGEPNT
ncbi:MAG: alpha/beta fold hydrolase [Methyloceanibacter sp.]